MTTDFNNKHLIRKFIYKHLSIRNPEKTLSSLKKIVPARILDQITCIEKDRQIILITNETWLSWLKLRHHQIKKCLPNGCKLTITNKHHEPLARPKSTPVELTMKQADAEDLVRLSKNAKNPKLQKALEKLAKRGLSDTH